MGGCIKRQCHNDAVIRHGQEVIVPSLYIIRSVCLKCPSEETDMPTTARAHCAPYWEQEVSLLFKLLRHFQENVML